MGDRGGGADREDDDAATATGGENGGRSIRGSRPVALVGLALRDLRYERLRTTVSVLGVALAVASVVLLAGAGAGVLETGQAKFDAADRDLWITGESVGLTTAGGGGLSATVTDAHGLAADVSAHDDVSAAVPMGFQTIYVGTEPDALEPVVGSGVPGDASVSMRTGSGFTGPDTHYANGTYEGPLTGQLVVDPRTADRFDLSVGETLYVGATTATAGETAYEVVGISETFASFLGAPTVTMRLSELQTATGGAGTDAATMVSVAVADDADPDAVAAELAADYPDYAVRTNDEQLRALLADRATVLVGAGVLVVLAVVTGAALTAALLALSVYQRRRAYAALAAIGISRRTVVGIVTVRGVLVGVLGWLLGIVLALPAIGVLNAAVSRLVGYDDLVVASTDAVAAGAVVAIGVGTLAAAVAAWRLPRSAT